MQAVGGRTQRWYLLAAMLLALAVAGNPNETPNSLYTILSVK